MSCYVKAQKRMSLFVSDSDGRIGRAQAGNDVYSGRPGMPSLDSVILGGPESRIGKCLPIYVPGNGRRSRVERRILQGWDGQAGSACRPSVVDDKAKPSTDMTMTRSDSDIVHVFGYIRGDAWCG